MNNKLKLLPLFLLLGLMLIPGLALAGKSTIEGTVQGYNCVTMGKTCPVGQEDPVVAVERVFVILTSGGSYYFVPNLDRAVLARHIAQKVRVSGTLNSKFKSITANSFEVWQNGKWRTVWSKEMQEKIEKEFEVGT